MTFAGHLPFTLRVELRDNWGRLIGAREAKVGDLTLARYSEGPDLMANSLAEEGGEKVKAVTRDLFTVVIERYRREDPA